MKCKIFRELRFVLLVLLIGCIKILGAMDINDKNVIKAIKTDNILLLNEFIAPLDDVNNYTYDGLPLLFYAIKYESNRSCKLLLRMGSDPNKLIDGYPALFWAARYDTWRIARLLIEFGADVNYKDKKNNSLLIHAAKMDRLDICKILIDRGANLYHENRRGKSAVDYAIFHDPPFVKEYMESVSDQIIYQDTVPSMQDGPYFYWENETEVIQVYYQRTHLNNFSRLFETTIDVKNETLKVSGKLWDSTSYHIQPNYEASPVHIQTEGKILAVGDVHGQLDAMRKLLINNHVIDSSDNWLFGDGHLVFLGDVFDRGDKVTESIWFIHELEYKAHQAGGDVHLLLGNHELMALTGDHRYLNNKYIYFSKFFYAYYYLFYGPNTELGRWFRKQNAVITINGHLFLHAGISPAMAAKNISYDSINKLIRKYITERKNPPVGSMEEFVIRAYGPLWYRGYVEFPGQILEITQSFIDKYLEINNLKRMVVGHNEQYSIQALFEGKVMAIDVPFDRPGIIPQGLLIDDDRLYRCYSNGKKELIKNSNAN